MTKLSENSFNINLRQDERKLTIWRYAGLMLTYKCPAACEFCYYNCSPDKEGLMPIEMALNAWQSLIDLAGPSAEIHITGGEPFLYFDHLVELLAEAQRRKLIGLDAIETNAYWAKDRDTVLKRMKILKTLGIRRLKISWDPFHAEYIDEENVTLLAGTAKEVIGPENVLVRWDKYLGCGIDMKTLDLTQRCEMYKQATLDCPVRFTGRAANKLANFFQGGSVEEVTKKDCSKSFLSPKGVHIDPYGNVFSGLCSGITIGNVNKASLKDIWKSFDPANMPVVSSLVKGSPSALLDEAVDLGFQVRPRYADKCHLCSDLRQFFFDKDRYYPIISPAECYS
jgi:MoaA/NifB/PqqE/SkfB family radical SAM enzyme